MPVEADYNRGRILEEAMRLPEDEREELAATLLDSLEPPRGISNDDKDEVERRVHVGDPARARRVVVAFTAERPISSPVVHGIPHSVAVLTGIGLRQMLRR